MINIFRKSINNFIYYFLKIVCFRNTPKKGIVIIKLEVLGDFIMFLPTLKYYKKYCKEEKISLLVDNRLNEQIAKRYIENGIIDEVILCDSKKFSSNIFYRLNFSKKLFRKNFKTTIYPIYYRRHFGDFLVKISNAKEKISFEGYKFEDNKKESLGIYTKLIQLPSSIKKEFDRNKYFIEQIFNTTLSDYKPEFPINKSDEENANKIIKQNNIVNKYVIVFPGTGADYKKWPADRFAKICDYLVSKNIIPVVCGSSGDKKTTDEVMNNISSSNKEKVINLTNKTDIFTLGALLKKAAFYFGSDTGILHLAVAVGCPTLCIMGLGAHGVFFPYDNEEKNISIFAKNMPCENDGWDCRLTVPSGSPAPCIEAITFEQAKAEVDRFINKY